MSLLSHTIVGVDGSPGSERALAWAVAQAGTGEVTAVHAFPPLRPLLAAAVLINLDPVRAEHKRLLESEWIGSDTAAGTTIHPVLVDDNPANALRDVAKRNDNAPIVVGYQGHGRWSRHHIGAVANRLLHCADLPLVMTTDATEAEPIAGTIAVAIHGPVTAAYRPIAWAAELAAERSASLHIMSVTQPFAMAAGYGHPEELYQIDIAAVHRANVDATNTLVDAISAEYPNVSVTSETLQGHPTEMLGEAINELGPALVVVGNYQHTKLASIMTESVSRYLPAIVACPVAAIPAE